MLALMYLHFSPSNINKATVGFLYIYFVLFLLLAKTLIFKHAGNKQHSDMRSSVCATHGSLQKKVKYSVISMGSSSNVDEYKVVVV